MTQTRSFTSVVSMALLVALVLAGCGGGGGSSPGGDSDGGGDLVLIDVSVGGTDGVALNQAIVFEFSEKVLANSVSPESIQVRLSPNNALQVPGDFRVSGNLVEFYPRLPGKPDLSDAGLAPGQSYRITLPGGGKPATLETADGDTLRKTYKASFSTAGASSANLFIDNNPDSDPHVMSVNPGEDAIGVPQASAIEFTFSEPVHPATLTTSNIRVTMIERPAGNPLTPLRPIPGQITVDQNRTSVIVGFAPDFPLADNAKYMLEVDRRVTDLAGNDVMPFTSYFTIRDEAPVQGEFVLDFGDATEIYRDDEVTTASWNDDHPGTLSGIFTGGGGNGADGDFRPTTDTTLNGDSQPGGIYNFRLFEIPDGVTVRLVGENPVTIRVLKSVRIEGTLDLSGLSGADSETSNNSAAVPSTPGGRGGPGGGDGGSVATSVPTSRTYNYTGNTGEDGEDGYGTVGTGGGAATWGTVYNYKMGAGGGSGGHATAGQAGGKSTYTYNNSYVGIPGAAGGTGGNAMLNPITGGGGGGAGMNGWYYYYPYSNGAGAGGGGGGALTLECAREIVIDGGRILAEGGNGGNVISAATSYSGGGGGAGAGGAILVRSTRDITLTSSAVLTTEGGQGGAGGNYYGGAGADGGMGWLRFEDGDGQISTNEATTVPQVPGQGTFVPAAGAPSVGQTTWMNLGVFDPMLQQPTNADIVSTIPLSGQTIRIEVQMASEDIFDLGNPDESSASQWVELADVETLNGNGYGFLRLRVTFTSAAGQEVDDALPFVDSIRLGFIY